METDDTRTVLDLRECRLRGRLHLMALTCVSASPHSTVLPGQSLSHCMPAAVLGHAGLPATQRGLLDLQQRQLGLGSAAGQRIGHRACKISCLQGVPSVARPAWKPAPAWRSSHALYPVLDVGVQLPELVDGVRRGVPVAPAVGLQEGGHQLPANRQLASDAALPARRAGRGTAGARERQVEALDAPHPLVCQASKQRCIPSAG